MDSPSSDIPGGLLYRRQFLISTDPAHVVPGGRQLRVGGGFHVSAHPDLELTQVEIAGKSLTLLGFVLDPDDPAAGNEDILRRLLASGGSVEEILPALEPLGGRWVLVIHDGAKTGVVQDAGGQRQLYFTRHGADFVCASEVGILAEKLGLEMDRAAVDFIRSRRTDDYEIYWMPGNSSLFHGVSALLPNHWLALDTGAVRRFWPVGPLEPVAAEVALAECLRLLRGQIDSARRRFSLAVPMTAGWDSRLMLALCRDEAPDLYAFTLVYPNLPAGSRDVAIPAALLGKLGIPHHVLTYPKTIDADFRDIFRRNNVSANTAYCGDIQALHASYPPDRVCVTGDVAEVVKSFFFRTRPAESPVTAVELAEIAGIGSHPFAVAAFGRWLENAGDPPFALTDLFCWEQMAGRWQAKVRAEYDMVQESFSPLNNRRLLATMLALPAEWRQPPDFKLFAGLIQALWPDVLSEPINPPERLSRKRRLLNALKATGMLDLVPETALTRVKSLIR